MANQYNNAMAGNFGSGYQYDPSRMTNTYQAERRTLSSPGFNSPATNTVDALERNTSQYGGFTRENQKGIFQSDSQRDANLRNQGLSGTWTSGQGGPQINDLSGYLGMKEQQSSGSDFSGYQKQLNSLVGGTSQNKYQRQLDTELGNTGPNAYQKQLDAMLSQSGSNAYQNQLDSLLSAGPSKYQGQLDAMLVDPGQSKYENMMTSAMSGAGQSRYQGQLDALLKDPSKIQQTAGYQFDVDQGNQAINRSAAAKGMGNSGGVLAELASFGQGMASREYGNQVNRMASLNSADQANSRSVAGMQAGMYSDLMQSERANRNTDINRMMSLNQSELSNRNANINTLAGLSNAERDYRNTDINRMAGLSNTERDYRNTNINTLAGLSGAERANRTSEINTLSSLMQNAQQFGLSSGRYNPEQYTQSLGIRDSGGGSRMVASPSPQVNPYDAQVDRENAQIANQKRIYAEHDRTFDTPRWR